MQPYLFDVIEAVWEIIRGPLCQLDSKWRGKGSWMEKQNLEIVKVLGLRIEPHPHVGARQRAVCITALMC